MVISKKFYCTSEDVDSIIVALAKEIEDGWSVARIDNYHSAHCITAKRTEPDFSIELVKKNG